MSLQIKYLYRTEKSGKNPVGAGLRADVPYAGLNDGRHNTLYNNFVPNVIA